MSDNIEIPEITTSETVVLPSETESETAAIYDVSLYIPEFGYVDGTITGGNSSQIVSALEDIKQLQEQQNNSFWVQTFLLSAFIGVVCGLLITLHIKRR